VAPLKYQLYWRWLLPWSTYWTGNNLEEKFDQSIEGVAQLSVFFLPAKPKPRTENANQKPRHQSLAVGCVNSTKAMASLIANSEKIKQRYLPAPSTQLFIETCFSIREELGRSEKRGRDMRSNQRCVAFCSKHSLD
jgi:hypothetical protein